jgi:hypothetical protein
MRKISACAFSFVSTLTTFLAELSVSSLPNAYKVCVQSCVKTDGVDVQAKLLRSASSTFDAINRLDRSIGRDDD